MIRVGFAHSFPVRQQLKNVGLIQEGSAFNPNQDEMLVAHYNGMPIAILLARPMIWVHGLTTNLAATDRHRARAVEALVNYSLGWGPAAPRLACGCLFQIARGNGKMGVIASHLGGVEEEDARLIRIDL